MWAPERVARDKDILATTGDYLRLWTVHGDHDIRQDALLNNVRRAVDGGAGGTTRSAVAARDG